LSFRFTYSPARVGLILPSALENIVFSIDSFKIFHFTLILISSLIVGISGNSVASIHFILVFQFCVFICKLFCQSNSISISSSSIRDTKLVNNLLGIAKLHSEVIFTHSLIMYSIAISRLFEISTILEKLTFSIIVSKIGVVVIFATA
jgi:hypothetical protein